jgi:hypothetical protein
MSSPQLCGSIFFLNLYDVCEEIHLQQIRRRLGLPSAGREYGLRHPAPEYLGFVNPPVIESLEKVMLSDNRQLASRLKFYDYGVVSVQFELPFEGAWETLIELASLYTSGGEMEREAAIIVRREVERQDSALVRPYHNWLSEDYIVFHVRQADGTGDAGELLGKYGAQIAQVVRGETARLSSGEQSEILRAAISYCPNDLAVVGWNAAFVFDTAPGALATIEMLEYANSQLLEFRYYDELLTRQMNSAYDALQKGVGLWARWRLASVSGRLYALFLDVTELAERTDNSLKFLSDMYSARLYQLAASKVGVRDYKKLVNKKLRTAERMYSFMVSQFHQGRAFVLELIIIVILILDVALLFLRKE